MDPDENEKRNSFMLGAQQRSREGGRIVTILCSANVSNNMSKYEKLLLQILRGTSDTNIAFDELRQLLLRLGFVERTRGSHHIFRKDRIEEKITLQRDDGKAKAYQLRQVWSILLKYGLGGELDAEI